MCTINSVIINKLIYHDEIVHELDLLFVSAIIGIILSSPSKLSEYDRPTRFLLFSLPFCSVNYSINENPSVNKSKMAI